MKKWILLMMVILAIPVVFALDECLREVAPKDIPCNIISTLDYPNDCTSYQVNLYNDTGENIQNYTMGAYGSSVFCNTSFNITKVGSYVYNISSGDTGSLTVRFGVIDMVWQIAAVMGMLGLIGFCAYFSVYFSRSEQFNRPLMYLFFMMGFLFLSVLMWVVRSVVNQSSGLDGLTRVLDTTYYGVLIMTTLVFVFIVIGFIKWAALPLITKKVDRGIWKDE